MVGNKVKFNWVNMKEGRGDIGILRNWYEKDGAEKTVVGEFLNYKQEKRYMVEGIVGGFSCDELIVLQ